MLPLVGVNALFEEFRQRDTAAGRDQLCLPVVFGLDPGGKLRRSAGGAAFMATSFICWYEEAHAIFNVRLHKTLLYGALYKIVLKIHGKESVGSFLVWPRRGLPCGSSFSIADFGISGKVGVNRCHSDTCNRYQSKR